MPLPRRAPWADETDSDEFVALEVDKESALVVAVRPIQSGVNNHDFGTPQATRGSGHTPMAGATVTRAPCLNGSPVPTLTARRVVEVAAFVRALLTSTRGGPELRTLLRAWQYRLRYVLADTHIPCTVWRALVFDVHIPDVGDILQLQHYRI
ncbi:unnamed protein product [Symbiodinium sp. CCMP2456]|nr:unnamed protein product [Symbiodinium sp. CCMP2456]